MLLIVNIFGGGKLDNLSFKKCSIGYWTMFVSFLVIMVIVIVIAIKLVGYE